MGTSQEIIIDKVRNELGYQPRVGFDEGIRFTGQWLKQSGALAQLTEQWQPARREDRN